MHSFMVSPTSIHPILSKQKYAGFCEQSIHRQALCLNEMLGNSDAQTGETSGTSVVRDDGHTASAQLPFNVLLECPSLEDVVAECAAAIADGKWQSCVQLINYLRQRTSPEGDALDRVISHFVDGLTARVVSELGESPVADQLILRQPCLPLKITDAEMQGAYLSLNQVTPFIRFTHLTANQAILEAFQGWDSVHIVDMDIMQGVQWPPLMQALADRAGGAPSIRITGAGSNLSLLEQTGNLLTTFAASLSLPMFEFRLLHVKQHNLLELLSPSSLDIRPSDALVINMILPQPKLCLQEQGIFLTIVKSLEPVIVTVAEREDCRQNSVVDVFKHYRALFDSLEATLPPSSVERSNVERVWFRREIMGFFSEHDGIQASMDPQSSKWKEIMRNEGFQSVPHSPFALSQARLLLRLHYPSQGYQIREDDDDSLLLGWQDIPLFGVSAWRI